MVGARTVVVERRARHVRDLGAHGARQHGLRVEALGQRHPRVEAAVGDGPRARGHVLLERGEHRVAALRVHRAEGLDLAVPVVVAQVVGDRHLAHHRRAQDRGLEGQDQLRADRVRRVRPADAEAGGKHLREGTQVDDALGAVRGDGRQGIVVEAEQTVGVVLDDQDVLAQADLGDDRAAFGGQRDAGGVVVVRNDVDELDRAARGAHVADRLRQGLGNDAVLVHRHVHDVRLACAEHTQRAHVGGGLGEDDVAGIHEELRHEVEGLLAARRDHNVVRVGADDAVICHDLGDALAQHLPALAAAVLHGLRAVVADQLLRGRRELVERQVLKVGHAACQGDDLGARHDREQSSNLGCAQVVCAVRVDVVPGVEAVSLRGRAPGRDRGAAVGRRLSQGMPSFA